MAIDLDILIVWTRPNKRFAMIHEVHFCEFVINSRLNARAQPISSATSTTKNRTPNERHLTA